MVTGTHGVTEKIISHMHKIFRSGISYHIFVMFFIISSQVCGEQFFFFKSFLC